MTKLLKISTDHRTVWQKKIDYCNECPLFKRMQYKVLAEQWYCALLCNIYDAEGKGLAIEIPSDCILMDVDLGGDYNDDD